MRESDRRERERERESERERERERGVEEVSYIDKIHILFTARYENRWWYLVTIITPLTANTLI